MLSTISLIVAIAGVILNVVSGWYPAPAMLHGYTAGTWKRNWLTIVTGLFAVAVLLGNGSAWLVQRLTHRPTLECYAHLLAARNMPDCTVWGITIDPKEPMKSVHLIINFDQPISDSVLAKMVDFGKNTGVGPHTEIDAPCHIRAKSADPDSALTFSVSSDRHEIIIEGHDFSRYDSQSFVVTFYPDPNYGKSAIAGVIGEATYEKLGHELNAPIKLTDPIDHTSVIIDDAKAKHLRGFSGLLYTFSKSEDSFLLNFFGIIAVIAAGKQAWRPSDSQNNQLRLTQKNISLVSSAVVAILMLLMTGSTWIERRMSHAPTVLCWSFTSRTNKLPNCAFWGVTVIPVEPVKTFHLVINFDEPIYDSVITNGLEPSENFRLSVNPAVRAPCNLPDKTEPGEFLNFSVSSDNRQIIVSGHDLTPYDSQTFILAFYPDPTNPGAPIRGMQVSGEATYEAFGHDLPAPVKFLKIENGQVTETTDVTAMK